mgnify:FL=1
MPKIEGKLEWLLTGGGSHDHYFVSNEGIKYMVIMHTQCPGQTPQFIFYYNGKIGEADRTTLRGYLTI